MRASMSDRSRRRLRTAVLVLVTSLVVAPAAALASHGFSDVGDGDFFHAAVDWMKDNGVTVGCNPSGGNTRYCPDDPVTRGEMAVFLERLDSEDVFLRPGEVSLAGSDGGDADTLDGKDSSDFLGKSQKATDADKLDGLDAAAFRTLVERVTEGLPVALDGGCDNHASVTIDIPVDGSILVEADVNLLHQHVNGTASGAYLFLGTSASDCSREQRPEINTMVVAVPNSAPTGVIFTQTHVSRQFDVTAGTHTFYLNGRQYASATATDFNHSALWATFYPG